MLHRHLDVETRSLLRDANPTDIQLRDADDVVLFDPDRPAWREIVVSMHRTGRYSPRHRVVVRIAVDSSRDAAIQSWRDRVSSLHTAS
jgi:hypothetical protein